MNVGIEADNILPADRIKLDNLPAERKLASFWGSFVVIMVAHFVCVLFSAYVIYTAKPGTSLFSWHPTLMTVAFMFLMAEAILIFSPQSSLLTRAARKTKVKSHWIVMVMSLICAALGVAVIWYNKELSGKPHMTTLHGKIGYITVVYVITQCLGGSLHLYPHIASKFAKLATLKIAHATSGLLVFGGVTASLILGMMSNWFQGEVTGSSWYACVACPIMMLVMVGNQVVNQYVFRKPSPVTSSKPISSKKVRAGNRK